MKRGALTESFIEAMRNALRRSAAASTIAFACVFAFGVTAAEAVMTDVPAKPDVEKIYVIYLHGRIIENAGPRPTDPRYGLYDYPAVLEALEARGAVVISAQRPPDTDMNAYAGTVISQIERLIERGVPPHKITVVGFSKGGGIATRVSSFLRRPEVRFVLLGACPAGEPPASLRLTGRVLSIYEKTDEIGRSCRSLAQREERPSAFDEIEIATGKAHGAFYRPLSEWVRPTLDWAHDAKR